VKRLAIDMNKDPQAIIALILPLALTVSLTLTGCGQNSLNVVAQQAAVAYARGDYGECASLYSRLVASESQNVTAILGEAQCLSSQGNKLQAARVLEQAYRADPQDPNVLIELANAYVNVGSNGLALHYYYLALRLSSLSPQGYYNVAYGLESLGYTTAALHALAYGLRRYPYYYELMLYMGDLYFMQGQIKIAGNWWSRAVANASIPVNKGAVYADMGQQYMRAGFEELAASDLSKAIIFGYDQPWVYNDAAEAEYSLGHIKSAIAMELDAVHTAASQGANSRNLAAAYALTLAQYYLSTGNVNTYIDTLDYALKLCPKNNTYLCTQILESLSNVRQ